MSVSNFEKRLVLPHGPVSLKLDGKVGTSRKAFHFKQPLDREDVMSSNFTVKKYVPGS